jgi:glycosyltransferase involved in cell wall biosynthesis
MISMHASPLAAVGSVDCGGQNIYVLNIARELSKRNVKVDIFTRRIDFQQPDVVWLNDNIRIINIEAGPLQCIPKEELLPFVKEFSENIINFIRSGNCKYGLIHANFFDSGYAACIIKNLLNIPFVITFHALGIIRKLYQKDNDLFPSERINIEKRTIDQADRIIAECPQDKDDLIYKYNADPKKICIIPCGFDTSELIPVPKDRAKSKLGIALDTPMLLSLGRIVSRKGIENILKAFHRYLVTEPVKKPFMLIVGGKSQNANDLSDPEICRLYYVAKRLGILDRVKFFGRAERFLLKYLYSAADIFITTPWYEPFGITPIEAMACKVPVIGSRVGGLKYTILDRRTGFLVPPEDPETLAYKINILLKDDQLRKYFGKNGFQRVNAHFTWEQVTDRLYDVYYKVIQTQQKQFILPKFQQIPVLNGFQLTRNF